MSKIIKITLICVLAFFIFEGVFPRPSNAQDVVTMDNGLRLVIKEDHRNPIVAFSVFIDMGSAYEGEFLGSGVSHLAEHMLFKGTRKYPAGSIEDILHIYGGNIDGFTSYDYTGFRITILKEHKDIALDILREILTSPLFDEKELKKEKEVIKREMDLTKDDPARRISRLTFSNSYVNHPYRVPIIGYKENFERLTRKDLLRFFNSNYVSNRIVMAVVGDIDKEEITKDLKAAFGSMRRGIETYSALPEESEQITWRRAEEKSGMEGAYLNMAFHSSALLDKDLYALDVLSFILGEGESSVLNEAVRIKKELVLSVSAYNYTPKDPGLFIVSSVLKEENIGKAIAAIEEEINAIKENGVTEEQLTKAKNNFLAGYIYQKETIESQANDLTLGVILAGDPGFFERYIENIKAVSGEDVRLAARKYLDKNNMTVIALTKSGTVLNPVQETVLQKNEKAIKKVLLKNNIPVLVSENRDLPIVSVSLVAKGGLRAETEKNNGISKLMSMMFIDGTDSMTRKDIARFYESKGMAVGPYSANNSIGISINCLKENTEDALKLASDLLTASIFPEEELKKEKAELNSAIDMQDNEIFNHGRRLLKELLFKRHPYGFQAIGTRESIDKITRGDVLSFRDHIVSADNIVIGISGDCDSENIRILTEKYFSGIASKDRILPAPQKEEPIEKIRELAAVEDKEQSLVLVGFHGPGIYDNERYAVEIMTEMFSSESGVLFKSIREKSGLSYAVGAFQVMGIDPGYVALYALTSKENIDKIKTTVFKEIGLFKKTGPSDREMEKTKNHLKAMRRIGMQTNSGFIFMACLDELYGLGCDNYKDYDKNIDSVTKENVKAAAEKFLTTDKCAIVVLEGK